MIVTVATEDGSGSSVVVDADVLRSIQSPRNGPLVWVPESDAYRISLDRRPNADSVAWLAAAGIVTAPDGLQVSASIEEGEFLGIASDDFAPAV